MLPGVKRSSSFLFLAGTVTAGWLLSGGLLPTRTLGSDMAASDSPSEWKTTHTEEPSPVPSTAADGKSTGKNASGSPSQTSRKHSGTEPNASGSTARPRTQKNPQKAAKEPKTEPIGIQLEKLFRGIGADLEEFFVGTRTVDKDD